MVFGVLSADNIMCIKDWRGGDEMSNILEVNGVTIRFGGLTAVDNVTMCHPGGGVLALIGPNGAGKTTFFNLLTGAYQPDEGKIIFQGQDITKMQPYRRVEIGIARTFQNIRLFKTFTVLETLLVANPKCNKERLLPTLINSSGLKRQRKQVVESCEEILSLVGLLEQEDQMATSLPYGKQRLLEIGRALASDASLILLDEPGAGMNAFEKEELTTLINYITQRLHKHILFIDHDMKFVMNIAEHIIVFDHGKKIAEGTAEEIQNNQQVIEAYLGKGEKSTQNAVQEGN